MNLSPRAKGTLAVLAFAAILAVLWQNYYSFLNRGRKPPESARILNELEKRGVPDFTLKDLNGKDVSLSDFRGKLVIVNFWASWCEPCVAEFPSLMKLLKKFKDQVVLLAVSADYEEKDIHVFLKAFNAKDPNIYVMWDKDQEIAKKYGTFKLPESYIVGREGQLIRKVAGVDDWSTQDAFEYFEHLLAQ